MALHLLARAQFATSGRAGVHIGAVQADLSDSGQVRLLVSGAVVATTTITGPGLAVEPGAEPRGVIALRVRGGHVRAYASLSEESVPCLLQTDIDPALIDGTAGLTAEGTLWFDHMRLGDGWWYQPREAVQVEMDGWVWTSGRVHRYDIEWDEYNRFRPLNDVDEWETRSIEISQDWDFDHITDFPIGTGQTKTLTIRPLDVDCWLGRIFLCDAKGAQIGWYSDVEYLARWMDEACQRWGLQGVSLWTLGQEDIRLWERVKGGRYPDDITA
jgi:hypothetical protein